MRLAPAFDAAVAACFVSLHLFLVTAAFAQPSGTAPRYLVYPPPGDWAPTKVQLILGLGIPMEVDVSTIIGYVMKANYFLPYNSSMLSQSYVRYQRSTAESLNGHGVIGRYELYRMISAGKACMLRAICEAAATPFDPRSSITAQLLHLFFTPSSTGESYLEPMDQEYLAAESMGLRGDPSECARSFTECPANFLDYITEIHHGDEF